MKVEMNPPKISIILPIQNAYAPVDACMDSVHGQSLSAFELLCVDMDAEDGIRDRVKAYAAWDARVKYLRAEVGGMGAAENLAIRSACGDFVGFVEPGDVLDPAMYERLVQFAEAHPRVDVVKCNFEACAEDGQASTPHMLLGKRVKDYGKMLNPRKHAYLFGVERATRAAIYRRSFLTRYNIRYREAQGNPFEDHGFWFQTLALANGISFLPDALCRQQEDADEDIDDADDIFAMCDEYDFIEQRMRTYRGVLDAVWRPYLAQRYKACSEALRNVKEEQRPALAQRMHEDFTKRIAQAADVDKIFPPVLYRRLNRELKLLLADAEAYAEDINKQMKRRRRKR